MIYKAVVVMVVCIQGMCASDETFFETYGKRYGVPSQLLWGIAKVESHFNPHAIHKNLNGTYDLGLMQINTVHLKKLKHYGIEAKDLLWANYGIEAKDLLWAKTSVAVGAYLLSECFKQHGHNWKGLTCYNGRIEKNAYALRVLGALEYTHFNDTAPSK